MLLFPQTYPNMYLMYLMYMIQNPYNNSSHVLLKGNKRNLMHLATFNSTAMKQDRSQAFLTFSGSMIPEMKMPFISPKLFLPRPFDNKLRILNGERILSRFCHFRYVKRLVWPTGSAFHV